MKKRTILFLSIFLCSGVLLAQQAESYIFQIWNGTAWSESDTWETQFTYDNQDYLVRDTTRFWDVSQNNWVLNRRSLYINDSNGLLLNHLDERWDAASNNWINGSQLVYTVDGDGNTLEELSMDWVNNSWENRNKNIYTYDANGFKTGRITQAWNTGTGAWQNQIRDSLVPNTNGSIHQSFSWRWNSVDGMWQGPDRGDYTYNSSNQIEGILYQSNENGIWQIPTLRDHWLYDQNGYLILKETKSRHPDSTNWSNFDKVVYLNSSAGLLSEKTRQSWDPSLQEWVNNYRFLYSYSSNTGISLEEEQAIAFDLFPNPANDFIKVQLEEEVHLQLEVIDMSGKLLLKQPVNSVSETVNIQHLNSGVYFLRLIQADKVSTTKFIKQE